MDNKYISIIIPTYNDWDRLSLCLDALSKQTYSKEDFEVIIVNNNPEDFPPVNFRLLENSKLITEGKAGSYAARNAALKIANGEIIGFTDSDCIPDQNWIKNAVDFFASNKSCSRIAGYVSIFPKSGKPTVAEKYDKLYFFQQEDHVNYFGTCVTANMFTYREVFDHVGLFNEDKLSCGDLEWGKEAHQAGYRIDYVDTVIINHPARDLVELIKKERRLIGGREVVRKKQSVFSACLKFIKEARPRLGEYRAIKNKGKYLTTREAFSILFLRFLLQYVRSYETMKLRLGKKPNRE